jgi:hypothetical protein
LVAPDSDATWTASRPQIAAATGVTAILGERRKVDRPPETFPEIAHQRPAAVLNDQAHHR